MTNLLINGYECLTCESTGYVYTGYNENDVKECTECKNGYKTKGDNNMIEIIEKTVDVIEFECKACETNASIVTDNVDELEKEILEGSNPFFDGWEDGTGNTLNCKCESEIQ